MAVRLRLRRVGKKKAPIYHIVAADSRRARDGKFLEVVGRYEPLQNPATTTVKEPRLFYWLKTGALPSDTVRSLLQSNGLWLKWSLTKKGKDEGTIATEMEKWQMAQAEKRQRDEARRERRAAARRKKKAAAAETPAAAPATPAAPAGEAGTPAA
ncbi:MAG TPA: 30S ribosomal protein S16 [Bacteroidota bacterium]